MKADITHGSLKAYRWQGCRCYSCAANWTQYRARQLMAYKKSEGDDRFYEKLEHVSVYQHQVLVLADDPEMTYEDIAYQVGVPLGTVRSRLSRARARIKKWKAEAVKKQQLEHHSE